MALAFDSGQQVKRAQQERKRLANYGSSTRPRINKHTLAIIRFSLASTGLFNFILIVYNAHLDSS